MGERCLDDIVGHGPDPLGISGPELPAGQALNDGELLEDLHRQEVLGGGPAEHPLDDRHDPVVDVLAAEPLFDYQRPLERPQTSRAEVNGTGVSVADPESAQGRLVHRGKCGLVDTTALAVRPVGGNEFGDGQLVSGSRWEPAGCEEFADNAAVLGVRFWGVVHTQIDVTAAEPDTGLAGCFVSAVGQDSGLIVAAHQGAPSRVVSPTQSGHPDRAAQRGRVHKSSVQPGL